MRKVLVLEVIAKQSFKDGRIEFDLQMLKKQVFYFQFSAILNSLVLSSWKLQVSLTIVNYSSENLVAYQDSIS